ncbi:MAG TPA: gluconate 2-dehydrogenase subunit 3 family protein [Roseiarcus sp.]
MSKDTFFDAHQRATVEAAMARMIPTDHEPGAREARTIDFVERYLSGIDFIYARPDGSGFETLSGKQAQAWRQRVGMLQKTYVEGIAALDAVAKQTFGAPFKALSERQQDEALRALERREKGGAGGDGPALQQTLTETELTFVPLLALHTRQGFYADPIYGGNGERAGWKVIGFPGPASLMEVFTGRYSALPWFAEGEEQKYREANGGE